MEKQFSILACLLAGLAVALGAFGAHMLEGRIETALIDVYDTGVRYHFYHSLALFASGYAVRRWPNTVFPIISGWLFVTGILVFSGSLYLLALLDLRWLGAVTPLGGIAFISGWICMAVSIYRS